MKMALIFQSKTNIKTQVNLIVYLPTPEALIRNNHTLVPHLRQTEKCFSSDRMRAQHQEAYYPKYCPTGRDSN